MNKINSLLIILTIIFYIVIYSNISIAEEQPIQQYNKIYLNPFYREGLTENTNYTYTVDVRTYDGISKVVSAIINFELWLSPSLNVSIWVNGKKCNTINYYISTTYASTQMGKINFDCSNVITKEGLYNITILTSKNTGAITGWLDLTYMNKPKPKIDIKGTEYRQGEIGKIFLQLLDENKKPINNSVCYTSIYYPDNTIFIENQEMFYVNDGLYQYEFTIPYIIGVYMVSAKCMIPNPNTIVNTSYDNFECNNYNCGYGWLSDWTKNFYAYVSSLASYEGTYGFRFTGTSQTGGYAERNFTINSTAERITLSFYARAFSIEGGERAAIYLCNQTSCDLIKEFSLANSDGLWHSYTFSSKPNNYNMIKINSTLRADDYLDIDNIRINQYSTFEEEQYVEVRGSAEIHVSQKEVKDCQNVYMEYYFDGFSDSYFNGSEYEYDYGLEIYKIIIKSQNNLDNQPVSFCFETSYKHDCSSITELQVWNGNDWENAFYEITQMKMGSQKENCRIKIETTINSSQTKHYRIAISNYIRWELFWTIDVLRAINESIYESCMNYAQEKGFVYEVPITKYTNRSSDRIIDICHSIFDNYFWAENLFENYLNDMENQEAYITEMEFYRKEIQNLYYQLALMTEKPIDYGLIWSYPNRTLTDYNQTEIFQGIREINNTINLHFNSVYSLLETINSSIHYHIDYTENILKGKIDALNENLIGELNIIKDKLNETNQNIMFVITLLQETNETIINKLYSIQYEIENIGNMINNLESKINDLNNSITNTKEEIINMIINISNATYNISIAQDEIIGTLISFYKEKPKSYALAGFMTGVSAFENSYYTCKDNETLIKYEIINIGGDLNKTYITTTEKKCTYGCENNSCLLSPEDTLMILLGVIGFMFFIYYFVFKKQLEFEYEY